MKKLITYVFALILLLQLVYAGEVFDNEVKDNVPFTINDIRHVAKYYPSAKKVSMLAGTDRKLIAVEDCEDINDLKYCIDSATTALDDDTGQFVSTMQLRVLESGPELDIDRSVSTDEPNLNEAVEVTATITNVGNERAVNANYEDKFPTYVKVSSSYYNFASNGVLWAGSINPGESETITYTLKFPKFITYDSIAQASFIFKDDIRKVKSEAITFEVQKPYSFSDSVSPKSASINEEMTYTLTINSTDENQDVTVKNVEVTVPSGAVVTHRDVDVDLVGNKITYSGTITAGGSKIISFKFKSSKAMEGTLSADVDLLVDSVAFKEETSHRIGVGISDIFPEINFNPSTVKGGGELEIEAKIVNNGEDIISEISVDIAGDIVEPRGWRHIELEPEKKYYAFNKIINAPAGDEEKTYYIKLSGSYETASGKTMEFEAREELTVLPQEKLVELIPEIVADGMDVNITLNIKNIAPYKVTYISLIDTVPKGFRTTAGDRYIDIEELAIGEERLAYSYVVKVPDTYTKESFEIIHIFNGLDKDGEKIMTEKTSTAVIGEAAPEEEAGEGEETNITGEPANETEAAEEEAGEGKPGIFKRAWLWIKGLFSREPEEEVEEEAEEEEEDLEEEAELEEEPEEEEELEDEVPEEPEEESG